MKAKMKKTVQMYSAELYVFAHSMLWNWLRHLEYLFSRVMFQLEPLGGSPEEVKRTKICQGKNEGIIESIQQSYICVCLTRCYTTSLRHFGISFQRAMFQLELAEGSLEEVSKSKNF